MDRSLTFITTSAPENMHNWVWDNLFGLTLFQIILIISCVIYAIPMRGWQAILRSLGLLEDPSQKTPIFVKTYIWDGRQLYEQHNRQTKKKILHTQHQSNVNENDDIINSSNTPAQGDQQPRCKSPNHISSPRSDDDYVNVLLLHGFLASHSFWDPMIRKLCQMPALQTLQGAAKKTKVRFICPDLLGFGKSVKPHDLTYNLDAHLKYLQEAIFEKNGLLTPSDSFHLVGHSMGTCLALELARRMPSSVKSLTLLSMMFFESEQRAIEIVKSGQIASIYFNYPRMCRLGCHILCERRHFWHYLFPKLPHLSIYPASVVHDFMRHTYWSAESTFCEVILKHQLHAAISTIWEEHSIPCLVVHGEKDPVLPLEDTFHKFQKSLGLVQQNSKKQIHFDFSVLPDANHHFPLLSVDNTAEIVLSHLCKHHSE